VNLVVNNNSHGHFGKADREAGAPGRGEVLLALATVSMLAWKKV
jgi:hypothetical protein